MTCRTLSTVTLGLVVTYPKEAQNDLGNEHAMVEHPTSVIKDKAPYIIDV
jgi:hypothetical protein